PQLVRLFNRKYPAVAEAALTRHERYNAVREQMTELERQGKAMIFYPENMMVASTERKVRALRRNYALGMQQTMRELPRWLDFLRDWTRCTEIASRGRAKLQVSAFSEPA